MNELLLLQNIIKTHNHYYDGKGRILMQIGDKEYDYDQIADRAFELTKEFLEKYAI